MSTGDRSVTLTVQGAQKRDAGRGVARLPEGARRELGVLSGDTVLIEGARPTVAKVWPTRDGEGIVRVDADTRANAGVTIGDTVTVSPISVADAAEVRVDVPVSVPDENLRRTVARDLLDRPLHAGETVRLERLGVRATVTATDPGGTVRVTERTDVSVVGHEGEPARGDGPQDTDAGTDTRGGTSRSGVEPTVRDRGDADAGRSQPGSDPDAGGVTGGPPAGEGDYGVTYEDIGGLDEELELVREMIELPLTEPELFARLGIDPPKGVLMHGPPGTGKTLIARAVANEVDAHFEVINGPEIVSKYKGDSERELRERFETATSNQPAVVFIDELDSIAGARDEEVDMENRLVAQLLTLLDGLKDRGQVVVIGATNRVDSIDPALRRGGRFDREIEIGAPGEAGRREILDVHTRGMPLADGVDLEALAGRTHGFVGADLASLVKEAAMAALRDRVNREDLVVTASDFESAMGSVEPSAMREYVAEAPRATFADVGGLDEAKQTLTEAVMWPIQFERLFEVTNTNPPSGVLLYGPPGTGKTLLARALAGESEVNFIHVDGPELLDRYVGESEKAVRELFDRARQASPSIVFLDEIDAVAGRRGESHEVTERVVSQLLTELDGLESSPNVAALAATNRRESLDPALLRPGRLESHVEVPLPDEGARLAILEVHAHEKPLGEDVDLESLAGETEGYSGAELAALVREASMRAIRGFAREVGPAEANERAEEVRVTAAHFDAAMRSVERNRTG